MKMYGHHPDGHLELELGDWKWNRMYNYYICYFLMSLPFIKVSSHGH